ncbi:MAG: LysE family translocator, partial [Bauldia sp.]
PGPTVVLVISYALAQGRRVAIATAAGVALGDFLAMTLSLAGLGALLATSAGLFAVLKWAGAVYLVYLGIRLWRAEPRLPTGSEAPPALSGKGVFFHAFAVTALNPKSIAFFIAFVPQFIDHSAPVLPQLIVMEATFVGLGAINALGYALAADRLRGRIRRISALKWLNRAGASCLVAMGAATVAVGKS